MKGYLKAVPGWLGSKRKLARTIMQAATEAWGGDMDLPDAPVFADPFAGGMAVSLTAKALGWEVRAGDLSPSAEALGKALVENDDRILDPEVCAKAITTDISIDLPPEKELSLPKNCRNVLARIASYERQLTDGETRWLIRAWLVKTTLAMSFWGIPLMSAGRRSWDELTVGQTQQLRKIGSPIVLALKEAEKLNMGVFPNGQLNRMHRADAEAFMDDLEADVLYLDPPYPGTTAYEKAYAGLNKLLEPDAGTEASEWSDEDGWQLLQTLFDKAGEVPVWVVSMGRGADPAAIADMMAARDREPSWRVLEHTHIRALRNPADAKSGDELLIVGTT